MSKKAINRGVGLLVNKSSQQVRKIELAIQQTLKFLASPAGKNFVKNSKEGAKIPGSEAVLIGPDLHFQWADPACVSLFLLAAACTKPGRIVLLGDLIEAGAFSSHKKKTVSEDIGGSGYIEAEIYTAKLFLDALQEICPDTLLVLLGGNHEARVEIFAASLPGAQGQAVLSGCNPYDLLSRRTDGTKRKKFQVIPYQKSLSHYAITDNLWAIHGWFCGVNFCMDTIRKCAPISMVTGHAHRQQSVSIRNAVNNEVRKVWCPGTLSLLQPLWCAPSPTDWVQGFSVVYISKSRKSWSDYTVTVQSDGECVMPGGTCIKAILG